MGSSGRSFVLDNDPRVVDGLTSSVITYETYNRGLVNTATGAANASGVLRMFAINLPAGITVTNICFQAGSTGYTAGTGINFWVALYDSARGLLRQSTTNTSGPGSGTWTASTVLATALSSTFTTTYSGLYYISNMIAQTGGTIWTYSAMSGSSASLGLAPILCGTSTGSLTDTAPSTAAAITATAVWGYGGVS